MKFTETRIYADPERAARKLVEIASTIEPVQEGRIHIEKINAPFLYQARATPVEYSAGLRLAIECGWLVMHESGTFVKVTETGAELFAEFRGRACAPIVTTTPGIESCSIIARAAWLASDHDGWLI